MFITVFTWAGRGLKASSVTLTGREEVKPGRRSPRRRTQLLKATNQMDHSNTEKQA